MLHVAFRTRQDYVKALQELTGPLAKYFSEGCAFCRIGHTSAKGYGHRVIGLETFARPLWGIIPLLAGGGTSVLEDYYIDGIRHGSAPSNSEYWGTGSWCNQMFVDMAALSLGF